MKAIKDCELVVLIFRDKVNGGYKWKILSPSSEIGIEIESIKSWSTKKYTKSMFNKFININNLYTKYKFI